jgi:hypothetical protein
MNNEHSWFFEEAGQPAGPVTESELRRRIEEGLLPPDVRVWTTGRADWAVAAEALPPPDPAALPAPEDTPPAIPPPVPFPASAPTKPADPTEPIAPAAPLAPAAAPMAAEPPKPARPTSLTVFGVLNIVFALLSMLCLPFNILSATAGGGPLGEMLGRGFRTWLLFSHTLQFVMSAMLLVLGVGLLRCAEWARKGTVVYGWFAIVYGIAGTIATVSMLASHLHGVGAAEAPVLIGGLIGGVAGGLGGLVYPVLQIVFMQRPIARAACAR